MRENMGRNEIMIWRETWVSFVVGHKRLKWKKKILLERELEREGRKRKGHVSQSTEENVF